MHPGLKEAADLNARLDELNNQLKTLENPPSTRLSKEYTEIRAEFVKLSEKLEALSYEVDSEKQVLADKNYPTIKRLRSERSVLMAMLDVALQNARPLLISERLMVEQSVGGALSNS